MYICMKQLLSCRWHFLFIKNTGAIIVYLLSSSHCCFQFIHICLVGCALFYLKYLEGFLNVLPHSFSHILSWAACVCLPILYRIINKIGFPCWMFNWNSIGKRLKENLKKQLKEILCVCKLCAYTIDCAINGMEQKYYT